MTQLINTNTARRRFWQVATFTFSFLFIPAFSYGFVSIWALLFGALLFYVFDLGLQHIIEKCEPMDNEGERCLAVIGRYIVLTVQMTIITSLAPIVLIYGGLPESIHISSLDALLMNYAPLGFLKEGAYADDPINFQILIAATMPVFVFLPLAVMGGWRKLNKSSELVIAKSPSVKGEPTDIAIATNYKTVANLSWAFLFVSFGGVYLAFDKYYSLSTISAQEVSLIVIIFFTVFFLNIFTFCLGEKAFAKF